MSKKVAGLLPVLIAVINNVFITLIKFVGFFMSGSGSMFSEAVHSAADAANQSLLLLGIKRSQKGVTEKFHYGYAQERFYWALVSACGIFFVGAGVTVYHGVHSLLAKEESKVDHWVFIILFVSLILESISFKAALKELREKSKLPFWQLLKKGEPTTLAVLYEDGIAVLGILLAFLGIGLTALTGDYYWDPISSIIIGVLLGFIAIVLANMNRTFLIEKAIPKEVEIKVIEMLKSFPSVTNVKEFKSSILGIDEYRVKCEIQFNGSFLEAKVDKGKKISAIPKIIGEELDSIKKTIQKEVPEVKHFNIEIC